MPPAAGTKHERDDSLPTVASTSKKRVRFADVAVAQKDFERLRHASEDEKTSDSDASTAASATASNAKKPRITGASAMGMFKKFVVNALDERDTVCSLPFASCRKMGLGADIVSPSLRGN